MPGNLVLNRTTLNILYILHGCYGLNIGVPAPPNGYIKIPTPKLMVLYVRPLGGDQVMRAEILWMGLVPL